MLTPSETVSAMSDEVRVISAALFLRRFTARQVTHFTGLDDSMVRKTLDRLGGRLRRVRRSAGPCRAPAQLIYELTDQSRDHLRDFMTMRHAAKCVSWVEAEREARSPCAPIEIGRASTNSIFEEITVALQATRDVLDRILPSALGRDTDGYIALAFEQIAAAEFAMTEARRSPQLWPMHQPYLEALASVSTMLLHRVLDWKPFAEPETALPEPSPPQPTPGIVLAPTTPRGDPRAANEVWRQFVSTFGVQWAGAAPPKWDASPTSLFLVTAAQPTAIDEAIVAAAGQLPKFTAVARLSGVDALSSSHLLQELARLDEFLPTLIAIIDSTDLVSCVSFDRLVLRFARLQVAKQYWREIIVLDNGQSAEISNAIRRFPSKHHGRYIGGSRCSDIVAAIAQCRRGGKLSQIASTREGTCAPERLPPA